MTAGPTRALQSPPDEHTPAPTGSQTANSGGAAERYLPCAAPRAYADCRMTGDGCLAAPQLHQLIDNNHGDPT